jgi:hypothetical protein
MDMDFEHFSKQLSEDEQEHTEPDNYPGEPDESPNAHEIIGVEE